MVKADCTTFLGEAQACARQCGYDRSPSGNNLLIECAENRTDDLASCCLMEGDCYNSTTEAYSCLDDEFARVKEAAGAYFDCILTPSKCPFGNFCVALFAGGYGQGAQNDFALAARQANSCEDPTLNLFGQDVCDVLGTCCNTCEPEIAELVNAVLDDILLTTYGQPNVTSCSIDPLTGADKNCSYYSGIERKLYSRESQSSLVGPATMAGYDGDIAFDLAEECNNGLVNDVIAYNESYAVGNYFDCHYKKTGKVAAELENAKQESSSISLSFGPTLVLSTISSIIYAIVA